MKLVSMFFTATTRMSVVYNEGNFSFPKEVQFAAQTIFDQR